MSKFWKKNTSSRLYLDFKDYRADRIEPDIAVHCRACNGSKLLAISTILELMLVLRGSLNIHKDTNTVELQWLEYLWTHANMFETGVV